MSYWKITSLLVVLSIVPISSALMSCVSAPLDISDIPSTANPLNELDISKKMIDEARRDQIDVLSPTNFTKALAEYYSAVSAKEKIESNDRIFSHLSKSKAWLNEAKEKAQITRLQIKDVLDARRGSIAVKAPEYFPKEWAHADKDLTSASKEIEKGRIKLAEIKADEITSQYRKLEVNAVTKNFLEKAKDNLKIAEKENGKTIAPQSYTHALTKYTEASEIINKNPRDHHTIKMAAIQAQRAAQRLVEVTLKIRQGTTEDFVLQSESQQKTIAHLRDENRSFEEELNDLETKQKELEKNQKLFDQVTNLRNSLNPNEAEVYTENGRIMIRLKGLAFIGNTSNLNKKNESILAKINHSLLKSPPEKITIEGHLNSLNSSIKNEMLSAERAKKVQDFLVSHGSVEFKKVQSIGYGDKKPLSPDKTPSARDLNRRIDIIIEPAIIR